MKRFLGAFALLFLLAGLTWANDDPAGGLSVRSFKLDHRSPERAAAIIKQLVSEDGSISIQPGSNTVVVTDHPENLRAVTQAIEKFDSPAKGFRVELKIVSASRAAEPQRVPEDLKEVAANLGQVLRFNSFERIGEFMAEGKEGDAFNALEVSDSYRADLKFGEFDPVNGSLRLEQLQLARVVASQQSETEVAPVLKRTALNLKVGQTHILLLQRPAGDRALMLVLVAQPE